MSQALAAIFGFVAALPDLIKLYKQLKGLFGGDLTQYFAHVDEIEAMVNKTITPNMTDEQKRIIRRDALQAGHDSWLSIGS